MIFAELIIFYLIILTTILGVISTILWIKQAQLIKNVERLTKSLTAQIIASGSLNQPQYTEPPRKNDMVS